MTYCNSQLLSRRVRDLEYIYNPGVLIGLAFAVPICCFLHNYVYVQNVDNK